jgi:polyhydroxybutyrate depolymerase
VQPVTFNWPTGPRRYLLHGRRLGSDPARPLVVMLHGTGGSAEFAAEETRWAEFADEHDILVAFPDGLPLDPDRPPSFLSNPKRWNDGSTRPGDPFHSDPDDVTFLQEVIHDAVAHGPADPKRVYLTGFSNGASMAFRFAAERPHMLAAVAPLAGYCHITPAAVVPPVPTLYIVGDQDKLIPLYGGPVRIPWGNREVIRPTVDESLAKWAAGLGCATTPELVTEADGVREERFAGPVDFTKVVVGGLGHHWPGGKAMFNPRIAGPPSDVLNGCRRVWEFFDRCSRGL